MRRSQSKKLEMDEWGSMSWYGVNSDKNFTVSLTLTDEDEEINDILYETGTHKVQSAYSGSKL